MVSFEANSYIIPALIHHIVLVNFPVVSGGFALLAATAANLAGLGGATVGAAAGPVLYGGVVTGIMPMVAAGAVGILGTT